MNYYEVNFEGDYAEEQEDRYGHVVHFEITNGML